MNDSTSAQAARSPSHGLEAPARRPRGSRRLFLLALVACGVTWLMLLIGGTVNPTGSSLACPDWAFTWGFIPLCHGQVLPPMTDGVEYEHGHRLWGWLVGLLTVAIAAWCLLDRAVAARTRAMAAFAVLLVIVQGTLGGVTVLVGLDPILSTAHLLLGYLFLALLVVIAWRLHPARRTDPTAGRALPRALLGVGLALILIQATLGGAIRHYGAGMICGDDWLACGHAGLWPDLGLARLHMLHRFLGYAVLAAVIVIAIRAAARARAAGRPGVARLARLLLGLTALQVLLGVLTVAMGKDLVIVTLHTAIGGLLVAVCVALILGFGPLGDPAVGPRKAAT